MDPIGLIWPNLVLFPSLANRFGETIYFLFKNQLLMEIGRQTRQPTEQNKQ